MPNGRSGGFYLTPHDLKQLLQQCDGDAIVGKTLNEAVSATSMIRIVGDFKQDKVPIEEQDHSWYIVHFPEWVTVDEASPLFEAFRRAHADYLKEWAKQRREADGTV